jgi:hypothetical protein
MCVCVHECVHGSMPMAACLCVHACLCPCVYRTALCVSLCSVSMSVCVFVPCLCVCVRVSGCVPVSVCLCTYVCVVQQW